MITHYVKIAFRNLLKYKTQTLISVISLAIGFTCFALSALWIHYETTYDDFHEGADRIYFAGNESSMSGDGFAYYSSYLLADYLKKNHPEVEKVCHFRYYGTAIDCRYLDAEYKLAPIYADSTFFSMFGIRAIDGNRRLQMAGDEVIITDRTAKRFFGDESPVGKQLIVSSSGEKITIVAVVPSWKGHSQLPYDVIRPYRSPQETWNSQSCFTLFRVYPNTNIEALRQKLAKYKLEEDGRQFSGATPIALLQTLRSTHPKGDVNVKLNHVWLFACIGGLVILCGLCNYFTMLITRIRMRKRELALRKVNGASDRNSLVLLLSELLLLLLMATVVGLMLLELVLPSFKELSQINENVTFFYKETLLYIGMVIGVTVLIAAILIRYISRRTLNDSIGHRSKLHLSGWFYKGSILFQLLVSIGFVFCTVTMVKQLNYLLKSNELGLERRNIGMIRNSYLFAGVPFIDLLKGMPEVKEVITRYNSPIPKMAYSSRTIDRWDEMPDSESGLKLEEDCIGPDFINFFGVTVLEGSSPNEKDEPGRIMINEAAAKALGWNQPIGKKIYISDVALTVKGVIKDIYYHAPMFPVEPAYYRSVFDNERDQVVSGSQLIFKVKEGTWKEVAKKLQEVAHAANPNEALILINTEETYNDFMKSEEALSLLLSYASGICILIAVFGIFSLITLSCEQRRKEVAIRKVNGASIRGILLLFFKEYLMLLVGASVVAFPLSYLIMKKWLENYMKQTTIDTWIYLSIFGGMGVVILFSIFWRIWKTACQNPAEVIKHE